MCPKGVTSGVLPIPPGFPYALDLAKIPTTIRAARAVADDAGPRLVIETTGDRNALEDALRDGGFRPTPDGGFRLRPKVELPTGTKTPSVSPDTWGTITVYTGSAGALFVATPVGGFMSTALPKASRSPREPWTRDLTPTLGARTLTGFVTPMINAVVAFPARKAVDAALDGFAGPEARRSFTEFLDSDFLDPVGKPKRPRLSEFVGGTMAMDEHDGQAGVSLMGFAPVSDTPVPALAIFGSPVIFVSVL